MQDFDDPLDLLDDSEYAEIEKAGVWPDDVNEGILLVPDKMTMEEWENADFTKPKIKKAS